MTPSSSRGLISTQTKTIKKSNSSPSSQNNDNKAKKYQTFGDSQKQNILNDLWKGALQILNLNPNDTSCDLLELLGTISLDQYNVLLKRTLTKHVEGFTDSIKVLTQWRKKVKSWTQNQGKPETRGGLVVSVEMNEVFRNRVIEILSKIPFRCFPTLQREIIAVLEEIHNQAQDSTGSKPFNSNTCSKHWWFNFIRKNADIKEMWEELPLERTFKKQQKNAANSTEESVTQESGAASTIDDSLEAGSRFSSSPIRGESYQDNCFGNFDYSVDMDVEPQNVPESPSRFFEDNTWKGPFSNDESDNLVIDQFYQQLVSPNQEEIEGDLLFSFLNTNTKFD